MTQQEMHPEPAARVLPVLSTTGAGATRLRWPALVARAITLAHHAAAAAAMLRLVPAADPDGRLRELVGHAPLFLTTWNFAFQIFYLVLALAYDLASWWINVNIKPKWLIRLRDFKDLIFTALVFPYTTFVVVTFWSLYLADRELVYPAWYDLALPWRYNLVLHVSVAALVLEEAVLTARPAPARLASHLRLVWAVQLAYPALYYLVYFKTGKWLYPIFNHLCCQDIILIQLIAWMSIHLLFHMQWPLYRVLSELRRKLGLVAFDEPDEVKVILSHRLVITKEEAEKCVKQRHFLVQK